MTSHIMYNFECASMTLGQLIRAMRHSKEKTLHQVSSKIDIDSPLLSKLERGDRLPTKGQLVKLCKYYGVSIRMMKTKCTAEKIVKEYGENSVTHDAAILVQETLNNYSKKNKG